MKKIGFMGVMIAVGCLSTAAYAGDVGFEDEKYTVADGKTVVTITNTLAWISTEANHPNAER